MRPIAIAWALAMFGCGGSSPGTADAVDPLAPFVGGWHAATETITVTCPGNPASSSAGPANDMFARGTTGGLVLTAPDGCVVMFDVAGSTAVARAGQSCTDPTTGDVITISSWTFTAAGAENASGTVGTVDANGNPVTCGYGASGTFTRVSQ
jgi:hypothetical protein